MKEKILTFFQEKYKALPLLVKAPGRINIIGEHTDYNLGYVLPAAIDKGIYFAIQRCKSDKVNVETFLEFPAKITFSTQGDTNLISKSWGKYIQAILQLLHQKKYAINGFNCVFSGDIPIGAGLSSSAALCCGFLFSISELFELNISKAKIALLAQEAEHKVGLNCGLMDQYAVLFGKKDKALFLDCKDMSMDYIPVALDGYSWVLINSNIKHELAADSEYNDRRISCENVVQKAKQRDDTVNSLRDVDVAMLVSVMGYISKTDYTRAEYVLEENQRVLQMLEALRQNDAVRVGKILDAGHKGLSQDYNVSAPEIDFLVATAIEQKDILGARMMGGGFGGCTINLMKNEDTDETIDAVLQAYKNKTGIQAEFYVFCIDDGVRRI